MLRKLKQLHKNNEGITLVELLVVIVIIIILATIATLWLVQAPRKASLAKVRADLEIVRKAIHSLEVDTGQWPGRLREEDREDCSSGTEHCYADPACGLSANYRTPYQVCGDSGELSGPNCDENEIANLTGSLYPDDELLYRFQDSSAFGGLTSYPNREACSRSFTDCTSSSDCPEGEICDDWEKYDERYYSSWDGPYLSKPLRDSWGNPYWFDCDYVHDDGAQIKVVSAIGSSGPDGYKDDWDDRCDDVVMVLAEGITVGASLCP